MDPLKLVEQIAALPDDWHGAGSVSPAVLHALVRHASGVGRVEQSVETGSGKTTLLLSHLAAAHTVFAVDAGGSISQVKGSALLNAATTTFVEGPTQRTLPAHHFAHRHQLVLIDGPHGYPFPDLEYYFLYPTIDTGGLLVIDDLLIPTIARMYEVIAAGDMFEPLEVVEANTGFLRRTSAPLIDPLADAWWEQGYNRPYYQRLISPPPAEARQTPAQAISSIKPAPSGTAGTSGWASRMWRRFGRA
ncbi:MAG TPA: class I SAM-dependent methyltransferase [Vicinamibacterales bacterium]|nr:class I SAM-dependent methyltransferase [Vicinamibacterales bacterium]